MITLIKNIFNAIFGRILRILRLEKEFYASVDSIKRKAIKNTALQKSHLNYLRFKNNLKTVYTKKISAQKLKSKIRKIKIKPKKVRINEALKKCTATVICFINDDLINLPSFLKYYRNLGIQQFLFVDFSKNTDCLNYLEKQEDVSLLTASNFEWNNPVIKAQIINYILLTILKKNARPLILKSTEYIVYPYIESRNLEDLAYILNDFEQQSAFCVRIDLYAKDEVKLKSINEKTNPFDIFKYMDRYNLSQKYVENDVCKIIGGPLLRTTYKTIPDETEKLNSIQMPLNNKEVSFKEYNFETNNAAYNCTIKHDHRFVSIALLNFIQFKKENLKENYYDKHWSILYDSPKQLEEMNLYQRGEWF